MKFMADKIFVDSNIWLYAFMSNHNDKQKKAQEIINNTDIVLNTQVVNEVCYNLLRKAKFSNSDISKFINNLRNVYSIFNISIFTILNAAELSDKYGSSFWGSLIIASALENDCDILLTEDISGANLIESKLKLINPFVP